jgi:hypothetical protein
MFDGRAQPFAPDVLIRAMARVIANRASRDRLSVTTICSPSGPEDEAASRITVMRVRELEAVLEPGEGAPLSSTELATGYRQRSRSSGPI